MRLFIAEKPSLGRAIAQYLPSKGISQGGGQGRGATHIVAGDDIVSWCFGHLLEMAEPDDYNAAYKRWSFNTLPIVPKEWRLLPRESAKAQINAIKLLLGKCDIVIHAGDPDREGQLLVDELLEHLGNKKPVQRIWLSALDESNVRKALANLKDNANYANLKASAEARQRGDWLVGMNLTRAYTLAGQQGGYQGVLSIGRVQTPTLALVVNRDFSIDNFNPRDFYAVVAMMKAANGEFLARWKPSEDVPVDESGRVIDQKIAEDIVIKTTGKSGTVVSFAATKKKQVAPLPFSLSTLQAMANKKLGLGAQETVDIAQSLYESKLTTYPRTDCNYLPESQFAEAAKILASLPSEYEEFVKQADSSLKSVAWNDKKITAHHAIIPTGHRANLSGKQKQVFDLIVRAYLAQFFPAYTYCETNIVLDVNGETFTASGKVPLLPGWKIVYGAMDEEVTSVTKDKAEKQTLPLVKKGELVECKDAKVEFKKTTPPARYTEGTLIQAMTNIHNLVDDPELKKRLKETAGIGTEATRAGIIETLKKRNFIVEKGKQIMSTEAGRQLITALPNSVKSPGLTGLFEQLLDGIADGRFTMEQFLKKQSEFVTKFVNVAKTSNLGLAPAYPCPVCKMGHLRRRTNNAGIISWFCVRSQEGCNALFQNQNGKPDLTAA
jgi:DNA topoisomerase-3